jgi:hypothetical protein
VARGAGGFRASGPLSRFPGVWAKPDPDPASASGGVSIGSATSG